MWDDNYIIAQQSMRERSCIIHDYFFLWWGHAGGDMSKLDSSFVSWPANGLPSCGRIVADIKDFLHFTACRSQKPWQNKLSIIGVKKKHAVGEELHWGLAFCQSVTGASIYINKSSIQELTSLQRNITGVGSRNGFCWAWQV